MLLSESRSSVNSGSTGFAGSSTIAPMGMCLEEFKTKRFAYSAVCLNVIASAMPPPRLVKRNSKSELRSVSTFSAKVGTDSASCGADSGEASGDGDGARIAGVAVDEVCPGVAVTRAGLGAICFARYTSHMTSPTTQRATTIHAVRSINSVLHDQTQRRTSF